DMGPIGLIGLIRTYRTSYKLYRPHKQTGKCHSNASNFFEKCLIAIGESGCSRPPIAPACRTARRAGSEDRGATRSLRPRRGSAGTAGLAWEPVALSAIGPAAGLSLSGT